MDSLIKQQFSDRSREELAGILSFLGIKPYSEKRCCENPWLLEIDHEVICQNCSTVNETVFSTETESINYSDSESNPTRTSKVDPLLPNANKTTISGGSFRLSKIMQRNGVMTSKDRSKWKVFCIIDKICSHVELPEVVAFHAKKLYTEIADKTKVCNKKVTHGNLCVKHNNAILKKKKLYESLSSVISKGVCGVKGLCRDYRFKADVCKMHFEQGAKPTIKKNYCTVETFCGNKLCSGGHLCELHDNQLQLEKKEINELIQKLSTPSENGLCKVNDTFLFRRSVRRGIITGCIYYSCKKNNCNRTAEEIANYCIGEYPMITPAEVNKGCNHLLDILSDLNKLELIQVSGNDLVERLASALCLEYRYISLINKVIENVTEIGLNNHRIESITSGCMYLVFNEIGLKVSKGDLSSITGTSVATIEKVYQELLSLKEFVLFGIDFPR